MQIDIQEKIQFFIIANSDTINWRMFRAYANRRKERAMTSSYKGLTFVADSKRTPAKRLLSQATLLQYLTLKEYENLRKPIRNKSEWTATPSLTINEKIFYQILGRYSMSMYPHEVEKDNKIYIKKDNDKMSTHAYIKPYYDLVNAKYPKDFFSKLHTQETEINASCVRYNHSSVSLEPPDMSDQQEKVYKLSMKSCLIAKNRKISSRKNTRAADDEETGEDNPDEDNHHADDPVDDGVESEDENEGANGGQQYDTPKEKSQPVVVQPRKLSYGKEQNIQSSSAEDTDSGSNTGLPRKRRKSQ